MFAALYFLGVAPFHPTAEPTREMLFEGVEYTREVHRTPRPMVVHILRIDLDAEGVRLFVTPPDSDCGAMVHARTTSEFTEEFGVQAAINANYFRPFRPGLLVGYPRRGSPVEPVGLAASDGEIYSWRFWRPGAVFICPENTVQFTRPGRYHTMINGNGFILRNGKRVELPPNGPYPRAAFAVSQDHREVLLVVVDGRQRRYSEGATLEELADILLRLGAHTAVRLDEGGSATLAAEGSNGSPQVLNRPIDSRIPGRERPVANHLGVFAKPLQ